MTWHDLAERAVTSKRDPIPPPGAGSTALDPPPSPTSFHPGQYFFSRVPSRSSHCPLSNKEQIISLLFPRYRILAPPDFLLPPPLPPSPLFARELSSSSRSVLAALYFLEAIQSLFISLHVRSQTQRTRLRPLSFISRLLSCLKFGGCWDSKRDHGTRVCHAARFELQGKRVFIRAVIKYVSLNIPSLFVA